MNLVFPTYHVRRSHQAVPLAAGCLAAALPPELRRKARLLDLFPDQTEDDQAAAILASDPHLVAFPLYVWNRGPVRNLSIRLRREKPDLFLVAGGPEATADPAGVLTEAGFDAVIRGEGEEAFGELVVRLQRGGPPSAIPGVTLLTPKGIVEGPERPPRENSDDLPSPWLTGVLRPQEGGGVLWELSRGCPFGCDFCFDARGSRGVRHFCRKRLEAELDLFVRARIGQAWVLDSTFNFPPERGKDLLRLLARRAPHIHFHLEARGEFLEEETVRLLSRVSCSVQIGLQSSRPEVLRNIHRSLDTRRFTKNVRRLAAEGVTFGLDLIYGLPGDDYDGFRQSLHFALEFTPNHLDIFPLALLPGTPLHRRREEFGLKAGESPPYEIEESGTWSAADIARGRRLQGAVDLFYNAGRAVGFFNPLLKATGLKALEFLEGFADWALTKGGVEEKTFLRSEGWSSAAVLQLQEGYVDFLFRKRDRAGLLPAAFDLLRYHFHYAETLLGPETLPAPPEFLRGLDRWNGKFRRSPALRLVSFTYEIMDFLEMGEPDLKQFDAMFRPVGSTAVFLRRGEEVICESLEEGFLRLLEGAGDRRSPREIFGGSISREEGEEMVEFALAEGFLQPL